MATIVLLARDKQTWFHARWSVGLWWITKVTPILAVLCMIAIALLQNKIGDAWVYSGLMAFVVIAIPIVVWQRYYRAALSGVGAIG